MTFLPGLSFKSFFVAQKGHAGFALAVVIGNPGKNGVHGKVYSVNKLKSTDRHLASKL